MTAVDADLTRLLTAFLHAHRRLVAYAVTQLVIRESDAEPGGHPYLTDFQTGTVLFSSSGVATLDPDNDLSELRVEAGVRPDPTGFEVWVELVLFAGAESNSGWPEGRHLLHEERQRCANVSETVRTLTAYVDRLVAVEDPLASVAWTRR
ncbi:hypothetical protein OHB44_23745 [Micromonospora sp. NBC_00821]|uniref:hypothetical protein n=1 Tax=Micromonospora sp. NBC_00821 TaxID=2975977 RepID=UPI002ED07258|nr:hypothetical protein OHB44_23745 [Micromonospora sp. NBC_00821]